MSRPRWELLRALGAAALTPPPDNAQLLDALGLPTMTRAEHTQAFVLSLVPHAAIYLGPEGKLGGIGLDRVVGFRTALGLPPTPDADHLGALLMLYAALGEAEASASGRARDRLRHARHALFREHIASWASVYLDTAARLRITSITAWAEVTREALTAESDAIGDGPTLPLALRTAAPPLTPHMDRDDLLDALFTPSRVGFILTHPDLAECADSTGLGLRRGERRFILKAMLEQDPDVTMDWLATQARLSAARHQAGPAGRLSAAWWARRAATSVAALTTMLANVP